MSSSQMRGGKSECIPATEAEIAAPENIQPEQDESQTTKSRKSESKPDAPINPGVFALGAGASFFARAVDVDQKGLPPILAAAREHQG